MVGMGKGAQLGVLIKDGEVLERLCTLSAVVFDKTGTITKGTPSVSACDADDEAVRLAAAVEAKSEHPLACAVVAYARQRGIGALPEVEDFQAVVGQGVRATVEGHDVAVGVSRLSKGAGSALAGSRVVIDGRDRGGFAFSDDPKEDAAEAVLELKDAFGVESYLATGDADEPAQAIAKAVGIASSHVFSRVKPLEKADRVREVRKSLPAGANVTAFAGDGINDAPALAAADIGVAMASGTDVALDAGSVVLMRNHVTDLVVALRLSRATMRKIKQNLFWALIYNVIMIPLAAFGIIAPAIAGAAMALSSVTVVSNSLLLKRFK